MSPFETLIREFGEASGIDNMAPDEDGAVELVLESDVTVMIQCDSNEDHLVIYAVVGLVGETVPGDLMLDLMDASLFGKEANGATFAIERSTGQIVLQQIERLEGLNYELFAPMLNGFMSAAESWAARLSPEGRDLTASGRLVDEASTNNMIKV